MTTTQDRRVKRRDQWTPPVAGVAIGVRSDQRMHEMWSKQPYRVPGQQTREYIERRIAADLRYGPDVSWRRHSSNIRAFIRVLKEQCSFSHQSDPMSDAYGYYYARDPWSDERERFQRLLKRLNLTYSDIDNALALETDIVGGRVGMGVVPYTHYLSSWFNEVMGICHE